MRTPWAPDLDNSDRPLEPEGAGRRRVLRLAAVLWLLLGAAAVGLYLGWTISPREGPGLEHGPTDPGVVATGDGHLTLVVRASGMAAGLEVAVAPPGVTVITEQGRFPVLTLAAGTPPAVGAAGQVA